MSKKTKWTCTLCGASGDAAMDSPTLDAEADMAHVIPQHKPECPARIAYNERMAERG